MVWRRCWSSLRTDQEMVKAGGSEVTKEAMSDVTSWGTNIGTG